MFEDSDYPERPAPQWVNYVTLLEDVPSMVSVDAGWIEMLGYGGAETLLSLQIAMKNIPEGEIAAREELPQLQELAAALEEALPQDYAFLVARSYGGGQLVLYIYTNHPDDVLEQLAQTLEDSGYDSATSEEQDPDWDYFSARLFPDDVVWQNITNAEILEKLAAHGDDGKRTRAVMHAAGFPDRDLAGEFARQIGEMDHDVTEFTERDEEELPIRVAFTRDDAPAEINAVTGVLVALAAEAGGRYEGWGTAVLMDEDGLEEDEDDWEDEDWREEEDEDEDEAGDGLPLRPGPR